MSRFNRESLTLVLGRASIELQVLDRRTGAWDVCAQEPLGLGNLGNSAQGVTVAGIREILANLLSQHAPAGAALSTVIGDECARYFVVEPPANARRVGDLRLAARLRMEALYGDTAADWVIDADWSAMRQFLACAVPSATLAAVATSIEAVKLRDAGVTTEFVASWQRYRRQMSDAEGWIVHAGRGAVVLAACADGSPAAVSVTCAEVPLSADEVKLEIARCALRWNLRAPATVYLFGPSALAWPDPKIGDASLVRLPAAANSMVAESTA